jgi:hypothetical protein
MFDLGASISSMLYAAVCASAEFGHESTAMDQPAAGIDRGRTIALLADRASLLVRALAQPTLAQLPLCVALAVPLWRSRILKSDGCLQLSDTLDCTPVTLLTDEFMLHLPERPLPFPGPGGDGVPVRLRGDYLPRPSRFGSRPVSLAWICSS